MEFQQEFELVAYVEEQVSQAMPSGWCLHREDAGAFSWVMQAERPVKAVEESFRLRVSSDCALFVIEHGNSDLGRFGLSHVLLNAKVVDAEGLEHFPLSTVIRSIFDECQPNEYGWT